MTPETVKQYRKEERALIATRLNAEKVRITALVKAMCKDKLSKPEYVEQLREELAEYYDDHTFIHCKTMGEIVRQSLWMLIKKPDLYDEEFSLVK